jgi:hypothetical protein
MKNPIPKNDLFYTPDSVEDLMEHCNRYSGNEKTVAMITALMAMNMCCRMAEEYATMRVNEAGQKVHSNF